MLEDVPSVEFAAVAVRFQVIGDAIDAARAMGVSEANIEAFVRFLRERQDLNNLNEYLDRPFRPKRELSAQSRFSDGTFPVFYSALDAETARAEIVHLRRKLGQVGIKAYYYLITCTFNGTLKDLRDRLAQFPYLIQDQGTGAYDRCNELAREALGIGLDAFRTISARRPEGECLPVFQRRALTDVHQGNLFSFEVAADGHVNIVDLPA